MSSDCGIWAIARLRRETYEKVQERYKHAFDPLDTPPGIKGITEDELLAAIPDGYEWRRSYASVEVIWPELRGLVMRQNPGGLWHVCYFENLEVFDPAFQNPQSLLLWHPQEIWQIKSK